MAVTQVVGLDESGPSASSGICSCVARVDAGITTSLSHAVGRALVAGHTFSRAIVLRPRNVPRQPVSGRMVIYPMTAVRSGSGAVVLISLSDTVCLLDPLAEANPAGAAATGR